MEGYVTLVIGFTDTSMIGFPAHPAFGATVATSNAEGLGNSDRPVLRSQRRRRKLSFRSTAPPG